MVQAFLKKWWVESDFKAPNLRSHYGSKVPAVTTGMKPDVSYFNKDTVAYYSSVSIWIAWSIRTHWKSTTHLIKLSKYGYFYQQEYRGTADSTVSIWLLGLSTSYLPQLFNSTLITPSILQVKSKVEDSTWFICIQNKWNCSICFYF